MQADNEARTSARAEMEENEGVVAVIKLLLEAGVRCEMGRVAR